MPPIHLAVPGKHFGLTLILVFSDRCGKEALPSSATGSGSAPFPSRRRLFGSLPEGAVERSETEGVLSFFRALSLDFAEGGCYTQFVRNQEPEASVFWF